MELHTVITSASSGSSLQGLTWLVICCLYYDISHCPVLCSQLFTTAKSLIVNTPPLQLRLQTKKHHKYNDIFLNCLFVHHSCFFLVTHQWYLYINKTYKYVTPSFFFNSTTFTYYSATPDIVPLLQSLRQLHLCVWRPLVHYTSSTDSKQFCKIKNFTKLTLRQTPPVVSMCCGKGFGLKRQQRVRHYALL